MFHVEFSEASAPLLVRGIAPVTSSG